MYYVKISIYVLHSGEHGSLDCSISYELHLTLDNGQESPYLQSSASWQVQYYLWLDLMVTVQYSKILRVIIIYAVFDYCTLPKKGPTHQRKE